MIVQLSYLHGVRECDASFGVTIPLTQRPPSRRSNNSTKRPCFAPAKQPVPVIILNYVRTQRE